jgi:hypothetical protein
MQAGQDASMEAPLIGQDVLRVLRLHQVKPLCTTRPSVLPNTLVHWARCISQKASVKVPVTPIHSLTHTQTNTPAAPGLPAPGG